MNTYTPRHTLAILRRVIELTQSDLADLVGRSPRTIQAIEAGRLTLSEDLAVRTSHETGVSMHWLLANRPDDPPTTAVSGTAFTKSVYEETRAKILAGENPNMAEISFSQDGIAPNVGPAPLIRQIFDRVNSLQHPDMDFWLVSVLSAIFAAVKAGQARLAMYRLSEFTKAMHKEFGQQLGDEFCNDATIVFEDALLRVKLVEFLVRKHKHASSGEQISGGQAQIDILQDTRTGRGLEDMDEELLWDSLNNAGDRINARRTALLQSKEELTEGVRQLLSTRKATNVTASKSTALKARKRKSSSSS